MTQETWTAVDKYLNDVYTPADSALDAALRASDAAGLPPINVAPTQGKLLHLLARTINARRILEIGTLGGYSTIWLARALPQDGKLISLEADAKHAEVARNNIANAGLDDKVEVRLGKALETLPTLQAENAGPFDFVFIDADKQSNVEYFDWAVRLSHPGSLIVVDNVVRNGGVVDAASNDPSVQGTRRFHAAMANDSRVAASALQTVGAKGYDGLMIALVIRN